MQLGSDVQALDRIECAERAPRVAGELPIDPLRQHGLVIAVVNDQRGPPGLFASSDLSLCQMEAVSASRA